MGVCTVYVRPQSSLTLVVFPSRSSTHQFVPAYKATRIIAEILIESLPQCIFQSYIYIIVVHHVQVGKQDQLVSPRPYFTSPRLISPHLKTRRSGQRVLRSWRW